MFVGDDASPCPIGWKYRGITEKKRLEIQLISASYFGVFTGLRHSGGMRSGGHACERKGLTTLLDQGGKQQGGGVARYRKCCGWGTQAGGAVVLSNSFCTRQITGFQECQQLHSLGQLHFAWLATRAQSTNSHAVDALVSSTAVAAPQRGADSEMRQQYSTRNVLLLFR